MNCQISTCRTIHAPFTGNHSRIMGRRFVMWICLAIMPFGSWAQEDLDVLCSCYGAYPQVCESWVPSANYNPATVCDAVTPEPGKIICEECTTSSGGIGSVNCDKCQPPPQIDTTTECPSSVVYCLGSDCQTYVTEFQGTTPNPITSPEDLDVLCNCYGAYPPVCESWVPSANFNQETVCDALTSEPGDSGTITSSWACVVTTNPTLPASIIIDETEYPLVTNTPTSNHDIIIEQDLSLFIMRHPGKGACSLQGICCGKGCVRSGRHSNSCHKQGATRDCVIDQEIVLPILQTRKQKITA